MRTMKGRNTFSVILLMGALLALTAACVPQTAPPRAAFVADEQTPTTSGSNGGTTDSEILAGFSGENRNFIDKAGARTFDVQNLDITGVDSFTVWGETVQATINALPVETKVCLMTEFKNTNPSRILVLSAVRRRQILTTQVTATGTISTVAYSWLVLPGDMQRNETDCLTTGLINAKNQIFGATATLKFSLQDICSDCTNSPQSEGLRAHFDSGSALNDVNIAGLKLKIQVGTTTTNPGQTCSSNSACAGIGFNCCLEGQCVNDGAVKNGIDTSTPAFIAAWEDYQNNPTRFKIYPQFFYVCPTTIPTVPGDDDATDPEFASRKRLNEMQDLFQCLNPQFDEIGYCAYKVPNASTLIQSTNPADKNFTVPFDDNNFRWANGLLNSNSIYSIRYGEQVLYQEGLTGFDAPSVLGSYSFASGGNGTLSAAQTVNVSKILPSNALDDTLIIKYKVDATCLKLSSLLARCSKTYVQGRASTTPRPADHSNSSSFALPDYANLVDYLPIVKVGDTPVASGAGSWQVVGQNINFSPAPTTNQTVQITYYVTPDVGIDLDVLTTGRRTAQTRVNELCGCGVIGTTNCNLAPVTQSNAGVTTTTDYSCVYPPPPLPEPPLQQVVFVSGKTVPYRYFDINGAVWDNDSGANAPAQEGLPFSYTNGNRLLPNNVTSYVGMNEIYGSFNKQGSAAKPPRMVQVKKGTNYDIFVDSGAFASCENCGNDPYSPILKLFPSTFATRGGGYVPDLYNTTRSSTTATYRADDLLFGRSCFVPTTMLAWSHAANTNVKTQRQRRLAAQHFMFANGYQRDWYGFDYGSLIGSFDGVNWFSIGNSRRVKAAGTRLLLAVNGYFGDQTIDNNFKVVVSETVAAVNSGSNVIHDTMSDGAECQKNHFCSNDDDCVAQLGYDYTCQNVATINTPWPTFDSAGNENSGSETRSLISLLGGANGQTRRCVYRGRGAPCEANLNNLTATYNGTDAVGFAACSPNHYCAQVDGTARFNTSIARFASSPSSQNLLGTLGTKDTIGLGARYIGRPLDYFGTKTAASVNSTAWGLTSSFTLREHFKLGTGTSSVNVDGLCLPGRDVAGSTTFADAHSRVPPTSDKESADRMFGVGTTGKVTTLAPTNSKFLGMCPAVVDGQFAHHNPAANITDPTYMNEAIRQNISTSLLDMTEYAGLNIFNTNAGSPATAVGYQRNACLRAAGASCFSDMECGPSTFVATKMKSLASFGNFATNLAEQAHWKEELVCGNPEPSKLFDNSFNTSFDVKQNHCCREIGKTMKVFTQFDGNTSFSNCSFNTTPNPDVYTSEPTIAGVNIPVNSAQRNIRNNILSDVVTCNPPEAGKLPALMAPSERAVTSEGMALSRILQQYDTLDTMNQRMCCTGHWVRSFATENGGGHKWGQGRTQNVDKSIFGSWNWYFDGKFQPGVLDEAENMACSADNFGTLACEIRSLTEAQSKTYLSWISLYELVGIPQVMITIPNAANGLERLVDDNGSTPAGLQGSLEGQGRPLRKTLKEPMIADVLLDESNAASEGYISAASYNKLDIGSGKLKKVFSENEFNCCVPAGGSVPQNANSNMCCTGTLTDQSADAPGEARCCLEDFSDVTVYLNRYVSSEGRGLPAAMYDTKTGFIKDPAQVFAIAQAKKLCCSGNIIQGRVVSDLFIPLQGGNRLPQGKSRRFAYRSDAIDNNDETGAIGDVYDAGFRWNTHFYCAPAE
mgnify:CR=1 FL=1